ncbi:FK506-binding protein 2-1 [Zea mays]|uniref:FK506-binding protein 2-1 n=1 Tax=Zea mays TaxID=4577 RepID=A0A1D6I7Y7_MAIZE|nr:FK506-binding protein 2-1 [Zea mays]
METNEKRHGWKEAAALSGGHLCHVCGYQYPNPNPSAKLRRSHRKHCGKALPEAAEEAVVAEVDEAVVGVGVCVGEREDVAGNRNAAGRTVLGEEGGRQREEIGTGEANGGGAALRGSAGEVDSSVEDKVIAAEQFSPTCIGAQVTATELSENHLINCGSSENVFLEDTVPQMDASELSENGLVDCTSNSIEIVNESSGTELLIALTNGSQNIVERPAEREDSIDEYQDASPFLHPSDSEDGAAPSSAFSTEMSNLNAIPSGSSVTTDVNSLGTNGLLKDQISGEPNMTEISADSKAGRNLEEGALRLAKHEVNLKLGGPYEQSVNVDYTYTDMVDSKSDEASVHSVMIEPLDASPLQETRLTILEPESESTCSKMVEGFMEDRMHVLLTMPEASPKSKVVGSDNVQLETITNPSTNPMSTGSDLNVVYTDNTATDCSMELPRLNWSVEDVPGDSQPVENSSKKTLRCPTAVFEDDLPVTKMDDTPVTNVDDVEFTFHEKPQTDTVEENLSIQKTNGFTKEEVCNKQINPEIPTEDQFSRGQKHDTLLMDRVPSVKNPFNLDDDRNDDLFELPTESCFLEVPNVVESRKQVDSTSRMVVPPIVSNQIRMAEVQQCHNSSKNF